MTTNSNRFNEINAKIADLVDNLNDAFNEETTLKDCENDLEYDIKNFEYEISEDAFDEILDSDGEVNTSVGSFYPSDILKSCDPVAYRGAKIDYESNYDLDDCEEYQDLVNELDSVRDQLTDIQDTIEELQSELEKLNSELSDLLKA